LGARALILLVIVRLRRGGSRLHERLLLDGGTGGPAVELGDERLATGGALDLLAGRRRVGGAQQLGTARAFEGDGHGARSQEWGRGALATSAPAPGSPAPASAAAGCARYSPRRRGRRCPWDC